jgi:ubiquinone/menaquinone biosynthesis C-methylase UbiE
VALGRRKVGLEDASRWVFNRLVEVYDARPPYPAALVDQLAALAAPPRNRLLDLGAGTGHLALPLAERGCKVTALEPAASMLARLQLQAAARGLAIATLHASAEAIPLPAASQDLVVIADALHFMDAERTGLELARVLHPGGTCALVRAALADTPYMTHVQALMQNAAPRRPRAVAGTMTQLTRLAGVTLTNEATFEDATPVDPARLEQIVRSISFIGPAMSAERFAAFARELHAIPRPALWARRFTLQWGTRRGEKGTGTGKGTFT